MIDAIAGWMQHLFEVLGAAKELSPWIYVLVALGGIASAISPCYVPVLTMFGGYVAGYAKTKKGGGFRLALPFVLGNALTLAIVGGVASFIGNSALQVFTGYQLDRWIPGIIGLLMGFQLLGVLRLKMPIMPIFRWTRQQPGRLECVCSRHTFRLSSHTLHDPYLFCHGGVRGTPGEYLAWSIINGGLCARSRCNPHGRCRLCRAP